MPRKSSFLLLFHFCTGTSLGTITGMHLHIYTGANMELLCLNKKNKKQKLSSRKSRQMFCQKRKKEKKKKICPCKCKNVCIQISILLGLQIHTHTHRGPRQSSGPGSGLDGGWPDWLSTRLAGGQGLSGGPGIITCE